MNYLDRDPSSGNSSGMNVCLTTGCGSELVQLVNIAKIGNEEVEAQWFATLHCPNCHSTTTGNYTDDEFRDFQKDRTEGMVELAKALGELVSTDGGGEAIQIDF